jgi:ABC-type uncharacterized transport system permease subunit
MPAHDTRSDSLQTPTDGLRTAVKIAVVQSAASWLVRRVMESGYQRATGHSPPTARDQGVPLRQILVWAGVSAAAVAVANVVADRIVLRQGSSGPAGEMEDRARSGLR